MSRTTKFRAPSNARPGSSAPFPCISRPASFVAEYQISTDSTAGERERGSLEPLLVNPVPRFELVAGKWLAAVVSAFIGMTATVVILFVVLMRLPLEDLGFRFRFGMPDALLLFAAALPMALIAPALHQMYLSSFAKSFKEAQSYMPDFFADAPRNARRFLPDRRAPLACAYSGPWPICALDRYPGWQAAEPVYFIPLRCRQPASPCCFLALTTRLFKKEDYFG